MLSDQKKNVCPIQMKIIPLNPDKTPQVRDWRRPENYDAHTRKGKTSAYHGVLTGKVNNLVVIDFDTQKEGEHEGKVVDVNGKLYDLPTLQDIFGESAYIVKTRSGGFHVYCKLASDSPAQTTKILNCIDVRNEGGYVVGAGSPGYEVVQGDIDTLVEVPELMKQLAPKKDKTQRKQTTRQRNEVIQDDSEMTKILESVGFTGVEFRWDSTPYNFWCDQIGSQCPLCENIHLNNNYYYHEGDNGEIWVKNHSTKCASKLIDSYKAMKYGFEKRVCRINDTLIYPSDDRHEICMYSKSSLEERFGDWRCPECPNGDFIKQWLRDKNKRQFRKMDFYPENCPEDVYNTWKPYDVECIDPELGKRGTIEPFVKLMNALTASEPDYAYDYFAFLFQHPNEKPRTCLVFKGGSGDGKGRMMQVFHTLMGKHLCYETNNSEQDVFGQYADAFDRTKLVIMNESNASANHKNEAKLKSYITDEDGLRVRRPYIHQYSIRNLAGVVLCTNDTVPLRVPVDDRRVALYHTSPTFRNDQAFFKNFMHWLDQPENQRAVYDFLMARDLTGIDWVEDVPKTKAFLEVRNSCLPPVLKWLEYLVVDAFPKSFEQDITGRPNKFVKSSSLLSHFSSWNTREGRVSDASFGLKMKKCKEEFDIPDTALLGVHRNDGKYWFVDRVCLYDWLVLRGFTSHVGLPLPESVTSRFGHDQFY